MRFGPSVMAAVLQAYASRFVSSLRTRRWVFASPLTPVCDRLNTIDGNVAVCVESHMRHIPVLSAERGRIQWQGEL